MTGTIQSIIRKVRQRIQLERVAKGAAILVLFLLAGSLVSTYLLSQSNFSDTALWWTRILGLAAAAGLFIYYLFRPLVHPPAGRQIARFLEERNPQLRERLSTAVEIEEEPSRTDPEIRRLIQEDARKELARLRQPRFYFPRRSLASLATLGISLLAFALLLFRGPDVYPYSLDKIMRGWYDKSQPPIYSITVTPGNVTVGKRSDLEIGARLEGFDSDEVRLSVRYDGEPDWETTEMRPDPRGGSFLFLLFDIRDPFQYFVESDGIQSEVFVVQVSEIPRVERMTLTLDFPSYTKLTDVIQENDGDIRALVGTEVRMVLETDQPVLAGKIRLESGGEIPLDLTAPTTLQGSLKVSRDDYYRIHLEDREGFWNPASDEWVIEALEDQPPLVRFSRPGRDRKVSNIEEIFAEIKAEDDYGISNLSLRYSVNGQPEQEAPLDYPKGSTSFSTSHVFYLEEFDLQPGDFVSYYAEASDALSSGGTDIYFLEVQPFDREYYQSQQSGMPGGQRDQTLELSKRQKEIIAATFKLERDKEGYDREELTEDGQTLALVQQRLQAETQTIIDRMERRAGAVSDPRFKKMTDHLRKAITHMEPAHLHLNALETEEALPEEQKSLQQLLQSEALFKEVQVSFAQNQGGGGASPEDLADLVDLELDQTKNQYETLQQNRESNQEQALDEALEKLKELAKRQEQLVERQRQRAMQNASGGAGLSQQELIEEAEKMARELERLSRQQQNQQLQDITRSLRQAIRDMRRAQSAGQNNQEAQMRAQQALERLREAQSSLGQQRQQQLGESMQRLREESQRLSEKQQEVLEQMKGLEPAQQPGRLDPEYLAQLRSLIGEKLNLQEDLQKLESELHQTARQLESNQQEAARKLKEAALDVRDQRIPEKMEEGTQLLARGWKDLAQEREEGVALHLQELAEKVREADRALGKGPDQDPKERLQQALNQVGNLVENLESLGERAASQTREGGQEFSEPNPNGEPSEGDQTGQESRQSDSRGQQPGQGQRAQQGSREGSEQAAPVPMGGSARSGQSPNTYGLSPRQMGREWQERLRDARNLQGLLEGQEGLEGAVGNLIRRMRMMDAQRILEDPAEVARLKAQIIDGFRQLELEINQSLEEETTQFLRLVDQDEVPPEFRRQVEEYYRALASRKNR